MSSKKTKTGTNADKEKLLDDVYAKAEEARDEPAKAPPKRRNSMGGNRGPCAKLGFCLARNSTVVMIGLYLLIGVMFYGGEEDWSVLNSMFFTLFTLTTVGYGCPDCPSTQKSRMFTAIYALAGIGLIASIMLGAIEKGMKQAEEMAAMEKKDTVAAVGASMNESDDAKGSRAAAARRNGKLCKMISVLVGLIFHMAIVTIGIKSLEELDSWVNAFYSAGQTLTTVGYGDISPSKDSTKMFACIYMPTLVVHFGLCVDAVTSYIRLLKASDKELMKELKAEAKGNEDSGSGMGLRQLLKAIEKDDKGRVTPLAFLRFMAKTTCDVSPGTLMKITDRFQELDVDNSGQLDQEDIARLAASFMS